MPWYGSHSFLNEWIRSSKCKRIMEIGVLNGDNAVTMIKVAAKNSPKEYIEYYGFDFFHGQRYEEVEQKLKRTGCRFRIFKGDTMDTLPRFVMTLPKMDLIFIDGGKSYSEAESDWENSRTLMHDGTMVFVHNCDFPGVKRVVDSISRCDYSVRMLHFQYDGDVAAITNIKKEP